MIKDFDDDICERGLLLIEDFNDDIWERGLLLIEDCDTKISVIELLIEDCDTKISFIELLIKDCDNDVCVSRLYCDDDIWLCESLHCDINTSSDVLDTWKYLLKNKRSIISFIYGDESLRIDCSHVRILNNLNWREPLSSL